MQPDIPGVEIQEWGCDVIAVNRKDSPYYADLTGEACYKVFRTYTIINWCEFDDWNRACTDEVDPKNFAQVAPRSWDSDGNGYRDPVDIRPGEGYWLLVRDEEAENTTFSRGPLTGPSNNQAPKAGRNGVEEFYLSKDPIASSWNAQQVNNLPSPNNNRITDERVFPAGNNTTQPNPGRDNVFDHPSYENFCVQEISTGYRKGEGYWKDEAPTFAWQYTQVIKVFDDIPPVVEQTGKTDFSLDAASCVTAISVQAKLFDACSAQVEIQDVKLAVNSGSSLLAPTSIDPSWRQSKDVILNKKDSLVTIHLREVPEGTHQFVLTIRDDCGNVTVRRLNFTVRDEQVAGPTCISGLQVNLMAMDGGGMFEVWAKDFVASPIHDCNGQGDPITPGAKKRWITRFSIHRIGETPDSLVKSLTLTCADVGQRVPVRIHAWDTRGNTQYCETYIEVGDTGTTCPPTAMPLSGTLATETGAAVANVTVSVSGLSSWQTTTNGDGAFTIPELPLGEDYTVQPFSDQEPLAGVSTFDLLLIHRYILGQGTFESPYQYIAADINRSGTITTLDMVQLRRLILNMDQRFAENTSWRFIPRNFTFPNPDKPWLTPFPEVLNLNDWDGAVEMSADFVAVKTGDINLSLRSTGTVRSTTTPVMLPLYEEIKPNNVVLVHIGKPEASIEALQFSLQWPEAWTLLDVEGSLDATAVFSEEQTLTYAGLPRIEAFNAEHLLTLQFYVPNISETNVEEIQLRQRPTPAEAYTLTGSSSPIILVKDESEGGWGMELFPNPTVDQIGLLCYAPAATPATLSLLDAQGRTVASRQVTLEKGRQLLRWDYRPAAGVYYCRLVAGGQSLVRRLVIQ